MTREQIIEMAREAGIIHPEKVDEILERFAQLVAAAVRKATLEEMIYAHPTTAIKQAVEYEREECAKICDGWHEQGHPFAAKYAAEDIRERI
jgi:hypothetical protein